MRNWNIFLMCIVLNISFIFASPIYFTSTNTNLNLTKGIESTISVSLFNNNNYTLYDIKFEGDIITGYTEIATLLPNSTYPITIKVKTNDAGSFQKNIKVIGFTKRNCSEIQQRTYDVTITSGGANPRNLEVCKNDNVNFINKYDASVFIDMDDYNLYQGINVNQSYSQLIDKLGILLYRVEPLIDAGYITSKDTESKIHDSQDDATLLFNIRSSLEDTSVTISITKTNYSMKYSDVVSGYFTLKNTGAKTAEQISLTSDWITFEKNNFNLEASGEMAINYVIAPVSLTTSQTNQSYNKSFKVSGSNFNQIEQNMTVFIEYGVIATGNMSSPEWWIKRKEFCTAFPTAPDCLTEPYIIYRDKIVYDAPPVLMNISPSDIKRYLDEVNKLRGEWLSYDNNWKLDTNVMKETIVESSIVANNSLATAIDNQDEMNIFTNTFYVIFGGFMFLIAISLAGFILWRYYTVRRNGSQSVI